MALDHSRQFRLNPVSIDFVGFSRWSGMASLYSGGWMDLTITGNYDGHGILSWAIDYFCAGGAPEASRTATAG